MDHKLDIDKKNFNGKDPYEAKYKLRINKSESTSFKYLNDSTTLIYLTLK